MGMAGQGSTWVVRNPEPGFRPGGGGGGGEWPVDAQKEKALHTAPKAAGQDVRNHFRIRTAISDLFQRLDLEKKKGPTGQVARSE